MDKTKDPIRKPTVHNMKRRCVSHDYSRSGYYHITISVTRTLRQPFGHIAGSLDKPDKIGQLTQGQVSTFSVRKPMTNDNYS